MSVPHILAHLLFWCIIILTYAISEWGYRDNFQEAMIFEFIFLPVRVIAVYVNWFWLIPRFLYQHRLGLYAFLLFVLLMGLSTVQRFITICWAFPIFFPHWMTQPTEPLIFFKIVQYAVIIVAPIAFSSGIKIFLDWYKQKSQARKLETEKQAAELKYLKAQVNPHFLFNVLNNIYGLSMESSPKVPGLIVRLSNLLSYSLYESSDERTSLEKEIKLIRDFIELEKERYENRIRVIWNIQKALDLQCEISPLMLIPLVENAFKHGVKESTTLTNIHLHLHREGTQLIFRIQNTLPAEPNAQSTVQGIGLKNLRRRLELVYPNQYELITRNRKDYFEATLSIDLYE